MPDGRTNNGGARAGAGRKPKSVEDDLQDRLKRALKDGRKSKLDDIFARLVADCTHVSFRVRHAARAQLFDRLYGRARPAPAEEGEIEGQTFVVRVPLKLTAEQWQQQAAPIP
jgi:hypothetical protein